MNPEKTVFKFKTGEPLTICAFGDSLTQGWMVRKGYTDFLLELIKKNYPDADVNLINRGIPGDTSEAGLHRLRGDVLDFDPDLVLVQFALNDAYLGYPVNRFSSNLSAIIESINNNTEAEIILLTSSLLLHEGERAMAEKFYNAIEKISVEKNIPLCKVHEYWKSKVASGTDHRSLLQGDGVHPTIEGYRLMAEAVMPALTA